MSGGDPSVFVTRPISLAFMIATVLILVVMVVPAVRKRRRDHRRVGSAQQTGLVDQTCPRT